MKDFIVSYLKSGLEKIYFLANIYHCENIDKVADEIVSKYNIKLGSYVNNSYKYRIMKNMSVIKELRFYKEILAFLF